jgi:hypothetical protein
MIIVPPEYRAENKRMKWEFVIAENGDIREPFRNMTLDEVLSTLFPYRIAPKKPVVDPNNEEELVSMNSWMGKNMKGCWQLWVKRGDVHTPVYHFEFEGDAMFFKLRWV